MRQLVVKTVLSVAVLFIGAINTDAQQLMSLKELEILLEHSPNNEVNGYFQSVPRGNKLESYGITIRGVIKEPGLKIILFTTDHFIAAGMSGSPAYVNGKLVGAVAYSIGNFNFSNHIWGGISPIELMVGEANAGQQLSSGKRSFSHDGMTFEPIAVGHQSVPGFDSAANSKFVLTTNSALNSATVFKNQMLKPGMPIIVDLVELTDEKGETTTLGAMGTVTYVDERGRVFAFGHPFLDSKKVVYAFRTAEVMGTVFSEQNSFKLPGGQSEVIGTITMDSTYGISGLLGSDYKESLSHFNLEFKNEGKPLHNFDIRVASSPLTPLLADFAFDIIGHYNGAPLPEEPSVTQLETKVELKDHGPIAWKELFNSTSEKFGPQILYTSSYQVAYRSFFQRIYGVLFENNYGLKITDVSVSANFIPGRSRVFKTGDYKFPNKVVWGQDLVLELLLVSQDNTVAIAKKVPVEIDWNTVEKPVYTKDTIDTEKSFEKVINGVVSVYSSSMFFRLVEVSDDRRKFIPDYFLSPDDFLDNFSRLLEATNQKVFVTVSTRAKSGLFDEQMAKNDDVIPAEVPEKGGAEWYVINGGLKERKKIFNNSKTVTFYPDLPPVSNGYMIDPEMMERMFFEVVLE